MTRYQKFLAEGKFPISFYNYCTLSQLGAGAVKDWVDAGITVAAMPQYESEKHKPADLLAVLDACAEAGIWATVGYDRVCICHDSDNPTLADEYRRKFEVGVKLFGSHPAVLGFHAGDEPNGTRGSQDFFNSYAIQKEIAPDLTPFQCLGPYCPDTAAWVGYDNYDKFMMDYRTIANPEYACFNTYWQLSTDEQGTDMYFASLRKYAENTLPFNIPLWFTGCAVGHFKYRCPTEDLFNWQINTAVAHGVTGIKWFFLYMREPHGNCRKPPIDEFWERTETFEWLSKANRRFQRKHGWLMPKLKLQAAYHLGKVYGGYPEFKGSRLIRMAASDIPLIISEFKDAEGHDYIAVVNNSQCDNGFVAITLVGSPRVSQAGWDGWDGAMNHTRLAGPDAANPNDLRIGHAMYPGQMEVWRL